MTIAPGASRTIDLYFPLTTVGSAHEDQAKQVPSFDAIWTVHTDKRAVTPRAPFERIELMPPPPQPYDDYYGTYSFDPYWANYSATSPCLRSTGPRPSSCTACRRVTDSAPHS